MGSYFSKRALKYARQLLINQFKLISSYSVVEQDTTDLYELVCQGLDQIKVVSPDELYFLQMWHNNQCALYDVSFIKLQTKNRSMDDATYGITDYMFKFK